MFCLCIYSQKLAFSDDEGQDEDSQRQGHARARNSQQQQQQQQTTGPAGDQPTGKDTDQQNRIRVSIKDFYIRIL
jgi:hypothetical protein